jgi:diadenosine tetraphosphate (Ap4A) HIT family hydrolase
MDHNVHNSEAKAGCKMCEIARKQNGPKGGQVIRLAGDWILNQYAGSEAFLGWLILQPLEHRSWWEEFSPKEIENVGPHIKNVQKYLRQYWKNNFFVEDFEDRIERIYVACYSECFDNDKPSLSPHLHLHIIPRTKRMSELTKCDGSKYWAWNIPQIFSHPGFPEKYIIKDIPDNPNAEDLMNYLKNKLLSHAD